MAHLHHRERRNLKRQRTPTVQEILEDDDDAVLSARVLAYTNHTVQLSVRPAPDDDDDPPATSAKSDDNDNSIVRMHLHQRFRSCLSALQAMRIGAPSTEYPFTRQRSLLFTSAKLLERKARSSSSSSNGQREPPQLPTLLPTPYVAVVLEDHERELRDRAWRFPQVDTLAADASRDEQALQQLLVTAQVLDIGAVRPCATPFHIQRQVVLLGDVGSTTSANASSTATASHLLLLWDDQVALSRLFHVGDVLTMLYPFVHLAGPDDVEVHTVMDEIASQQQRCAYYLEYGSATTLFVTRRRRKSRFVTDGSLNGGSARDLQEGEDRRCMAVGVPRPGWIGFSVYGHVASITVSHGVPLLAAFYHSYYDPKTNGAAAKLPGQSLNRAIVSKYYLVVLVELYDAISGDVTLTVELTGTCAEKALALREGQTVFLEGLVAVDLRHDPSLRASRNDRAALLPPSQLFDSTCTNNSNSQQPQQSPAIAAASAAVAFPDDCYLSSSSRVVALCSDWERIFGRQTETFRESRVCIVNELPSVLKTHVRSDDDDGNALVARWHRDRALLSTLSMVRGRFVVTGVGWMVPCNERDDDKTRQPKRFEWDTSCAKGFSTMSAHRACRRRLEMAPPATGEDVDSASATPRWLCGFCAEIFAGMDATTQTFCPLLVQLDDGSQWSSPSSSSSSLVAIGFGDAVATILETPPEEFAQLSLPRKRAVLQRAIGRELDVMLSRCLEHHILPSTSKTMAPTRVPLCVRLRIDQAQPVDVFVSAQRVLASLRARR
ncbi:hypothetical protein PINS_up005620 [Pythium insidiosum]|nr:hypothetical protein PINS_up005620 [Pythium insidiosum]